MGLFHSYQKEGKGVEKNAMRPIRPLYFFELFFRKFWKLMQMNLLYVGLTLPIWIVLAIFLFSDTMLNNFSLTYVGDFIYVLALIFIIFSPVIGPATAGMTYVLKSFATETPVFQYADFFEQFKKNFKQATLLTLLNGFLMLSFSFTLIHGSAQLIIGESLTMSSLQIPLLILNVLFVFMNYYAFSIIVMFRMKFFDILKNSFIFTFAKLPLNLFILIVISAISYFSFHYIVTGMVLTVLFLYAFSGFLVVFSIYPTLEKYMLIPAKRLQSESETDEQ